MSATRLSKRSNRSGSASPLLSGFLRTKCQEEVIDKHQPCGRTERNISNSTSCSHKSRAVNLMLASFAVASHALLVALGFLRTYRSFHKGTRGLLLVRLRKKKFCELTMQTTSVHLTSEHSAHMKRARHQLTWCPIVYSRTSSIEHIAAVPGHEPHEQMCCQKNGRLLLASSQ